MKYKQFSLLILGILISYSISAQSPWTLTDCINHAHANNLNIKQSVLLSKKANNDLLQSKLNILPNLNSSFDRTYRTGGSFLDNSNAKISDSYGLSSEVTLFSGLQQYNSIKRNEYDVLSKIQDIEKEKVNITIEISQAYLNILFKEELVDIAESQRGITNLQVERTEKLVEVGSMARGNLLEIKAQLANEQLNIINRKNELSLASLNLAQMLDLDSINYFTIVRPNLPEPNSDSSIININSVYDEALSFLPHVKSAEYSLISTKKSLAVQKGKFSPSLSLAGNWATSYSNKVDANGYVEPYISQISIIEPSKSLLIRLRFPIFTKWERNNNISNARINVLQSQNVLELTKQQLYKEIQQAHNDAVSSQEKYKAANEAASSYKEAFKYTEQKYNVGIVNSVEYNIAKNNLVVAESDLLQAKYEYIFSIKILDFYRGIPITL